MNSVNRISLASYQRGAVVGSPGMGRQAGRVGAYIGKRVHTVHTVHSVNRCPVPLVPALPNRFFRRTCHGGTRSPDSSAPNMKMEIGIPVFPVFPVVTERNWPWKP